MSITTALIISNIVVFLINNMVEVPALYGVANPMSPQMEPVLYVRGAYSKIGMRGNSGGSSHTNFCMRIYGTSFSICGPSISLDMPWSILWGLIAI